MSVPNRPAQRRRLFSAARRPAEQSTAIEATDGFRAFRAMRQVYDAFHAEAVPGRNPLLERLKYAWTHRHGH